MNKKETRIVRVSNKLSDVEFVKMIKDFEEEGYAVTVKSKDRLSKGYTELVLR